MLTKCSICFVLCISIFFVINCKKDIPIEDDIKKFREKILKQPVRRLKNYTFNPETPIASRVQNPPDFVLKYISEFDGRDYTVYSPVQEEKKIIEEYIELLPLEFKKVLKERLVGIYFINDFWGSGMADFIFDEKYNVYSIVYLNSGVLKKDITEWVTYKEQTCFKKDSQDISIKVHCGSQYKGLMYIFIHELAHVVDYVKNYTPYVEEDIRKFLDIKTTQTPFVRNVWEGYKKPLKDDDFQFRKDITFYGFSKGPKINLSDAHKVYKQLIQTPFVSLYAGQQWAEDFAECITFYHLTEVLKQPYEIQYFEKDKLVESFFPMKSKKVLARFPTLKKLYK